MAHESLLNRIHEGMEVYDATGNKVGKVGYIQFGDEKPDPKVESPTVSPAVRDNTNDSLIEDFAEALGADNDIPEMLRDQMLRYGYIKIDTGLLKADRYALLKHISTVTQDSVKLQVKADELIKA